MTDPSASGHEGGNGGEGAREAGPPRTALSRSGFGVLWPIPMRWTDIDRYGHANNVAVLSWFDTAVNDWYAANGHAPGADPHFVVAETGCRFRREILASDKVTVGIRVARLGRSSVAYDLAVFADRAGEEARAEGRYVHVLVSDAGGGPVPIEGPLRRILSSPDARGTPRGADGGARS